MSQSTPFLIAPECHAPGCHHDGDQYTMVKCRSCGHWFCGEHLSSDASADSRRDVALVESGLRGLSFYLGLCATCRHLPPERHPVDSSWLR